MAGKANPAAADCCASVVAAPLAEPEAADLARAFAALAAAGLIRGERRGRWVWWSVVPERLAQLGDALTPRRARV